MAASATLSSSLIIILVVYTIWLAFVIVQTFLNYGTIFRKTWAGGRNGVALFGWYIVFGLADLVPGLGIYFYYKYRYLTPASFGRTEEERMAELLAEPAPQGGYAVPAEPQQPIVPAEPQQQAFAAPALVEPQQQAAAISPAPAPVAAAPVESSSPALPKLDETVDKLIQYKQLLDAGILTQEEFDAKKRDLLK